MSGSKILVSPLWVKLRTERIGERCRYGSLCRVPLHPTPGICIGILESPAALSDDTHLPPIDERCGITSKARNQPPTPFLDTISPWFGVLLCRWRGPESRSFPQVGFSPRVRIHLPPAASQQRTRPHQRAGQGKTRLARGPLMARLLPHRLYRLRCGRESRRHLSHKCAVSLWSSALVNSASAFPHSLSYFVCAVVIFASYRAFAAL